MKKVLSVLLAAAMMLSFAACSATSGGDEVPTLLWYVPGDYQEDIGTVLGVNVLGEVKFSIPYLGYLASYIQEPPGSYVAISVGAILLLLVFLPDLIFETDEEKRQRLEKEAAKAKEKAEKLAAKEETAADAENKETSANAENETGAE